MNNDEMLKLILSKIESLEAGQNGMRTEMNGMRTEINGMRTEINGMRTEINGIHTEMNDMHTEINGMHTEIKDVNRRLDTLEEGQKAIRRDVARVDRKLDRLSADVGDTLVYVTENVDTEISQLRKAK